MKPWLRRGLWGVVALAAAGAVALASRPTPIPVESAVVTRGPLRVSVQVDGRTRVRQRYTVMAPTAGNLSRIELRPGDAVTAGQRIAYVLPGESTLLDARSRAQATMRVETARAALGEARAGVARAQVSVDRAETEHRLQGTLLARGAATARAHEEAELALRGAQAELSAARFRVAVASHELRSAEALVASVRPGATAEHAVEVTAPVAGQVLRVLRESAGVVAPGTPLVEVGDLGVMEVVAEALTVDAVQMRPGAPVMLNRWGRDVSLRGHVVRVEPSAFARVSALGVEEQRVNVVVALDDPAPTNSFLGDGFRVEAAITLWQGESVLHVPHGALFRLGDAWSVYVMAGGRARRRMVTPGHAGETATEVTQGLREGERVVVHPADTVREGVLVRSEAAP